MPSVRNLFKTILPENFCVIDLETSSLNPYTCEIDRMGMKLGPYGYKDFPYPFFTSFDKRIIQFQLNRGIPLVFHNAKFDLQVLRSHGFEVNGPIHDTLLLAKCWRSDLPSYNLEYLCYIFFGDLSLDSERLHNWFRENGFAADNRDMTKAPDNLVQVYCRGDVYRTLKLFKKLYPLVGDSFLYKLNIKTLQTTLKVERNGIHVNRKFFADYIRRSKRTIRRNQEKAGFNVRSTKQLGSYIRDNFSRFGTTRTGLVACDESNLQEYLREKPSDVILRIRLSVASTTKNISTYARPILEATSNERSIFHPSFRQAEAITRRFSCGGFFGETGQIVRGNTQNIPPEMREGFIAPSGYKFVVFDLSQIEARLWSHAVEVFLGDKTWVEEYNKNPNFNFYLEIARLCTKKRITKKSNLYDRYKAVVLARFYGSGVHKFAEQQKVPIEEAYKRFKQVDMIAPQIHKLQYRMVHLIEKQGYVEDDFGATYYIPKDKTFVGVNYYCQGMAGNIFQFWMNEIQNRIDQKSYPDKIINLVHDEVDMYMKDGKKIEQRCEEYCSLLTPLTKMLGIQITADYSMGKTWKECK